MLAVQNCSARIIELILKTLFEILSFHLRLVSGAQEFDTRTCISFG